MIIDKRISRVIVAISVLVALSLTGCAQQPSDYGQAVAERLQEQVLVVSTSAADAELEAAVVALNELDVELKDALARGDISEARYDSITAAAALVRSDLEAAIAARPPADDDDDDDDDDSKSDTEKRKDKNND